MDDKVVISQSWSCDETNSKTFTSIIVTHQTLAETRTHVTLSCWPSFLTLLLPALQLKRRVEARAQERAKNKAKRPATLAKQQCQIHRAVSSQ